MGMAASQARWLALTARKTNVEYEGQQINQARTALANKAANTFSELLALEVPTAPSTQDFTKIKYSYMEGNITEFIEDMTQLTNDPDGFNYMVSHFHYADVFTGIENKLTNPQVILDAGNNPAYVGNCELVPYDPTNTMEKAAYEQICRDWPNSRFAQADPSEIFKWVFQGQIRYACLEDLRRTASSGPDPSTPSENQDKLFYYIAQDMNQKIERKEKAIVDINNQGRVQSVMYEDSSATYPVITSTETDTMAYEDAMNQYRYNMEVYEKRIADINAKTEKIQEQDRTLELKLRQLDTEQEALQTEMEAVQKVIQKNIESTFKTFES